MAKPVVALKPSLALVLTLQLFTRENTDFPLFARRNGSRECRCATGLTSVSAIRERYRQIDTD